MRWEDIPPERFEEMILQDDPTVLTPNAEPMSVWSLVALAAMVALLALLRFGRRQGQ